MKKMLFLLFLGAIVLASCEKDPNFSDLDEDFIVVTKYDKSWNFGSATKTYYMSDSIRLISSDSEDSIWYNSFSQQIVDAVKSNMSKMGYQLDKSKQIDPVTGQSYPAAQYAMGIIAIKNLNTVIYYYDPWWYYYPDYWWWDWYYPYYPYYPYVDGYQYTVGTTLLELIDLKNAVTSDKQIPVRWNATISGMLNTGYDSTFELEAIDQAFNQSPYLGTK